MQETPKGLFLSRSRHASVCMPVCRCLSTKNKQTGGDDGKLSFARFSDLVETKLKIG